MKKNFICINCPMGCPLTVEIEGEKAPMVSGNRCPRGISYGKQEAVLPLRVLTGLMRTRAGHPLSVRSAKPIPKDLIFACAAELGRHRPEEPIKIGDVALEDICGTGIKIVATRDVPELP
jgi:CxxC motif-containing protein